MCPRELMIDDNCDNSESANSEFFSIDHHAACTRRDSWPESRHETVRVLRFVVCFFHIVALPALEKQCTFAGCIVSVSHRPSVDLHSRKYPDTGNAPPHSPVFGGTPAGLCAPCTECVFLFRVGQRVCALSPMVWLPGRRHLTCVPVLSAVLVAVVEGLPAPARVRARMSEYYMNHGRDGSMQRACAVERALYVPSTSTNTHRVRLPGGRPATNHGMPRAPPGMAVGMGQMGNRYAGNSHGMRGPPTAGSMVHGMAPRSGTGGHRGSNVVGVGGAAGVSRGMGHQVISGGRSAAMAPSGSSTSSLGVHGLDGLPPDVFPAGGHSARGLPRHGAMHGAPRGAVAPGGGSRGRELPS